MISIELLKGYLSIADNFDAYISPEIIESAMQNMTEETMDLVDKILYLRMDAIAKNAEQLIKYKEKFSDELATIKNKESMCYKPSKVQYMNYHLIALAAQSEKKEVRGMAAYAVFQICLPTIDEQMVYYKSSLKLEKSLADCQKDKKKGIYHSVYIAMYEMIFEQIVKKRKYDYNRAAPHTFMSPYFKAAFLAEINPGKKLSEITKENLIARAEGGLAMKGIETPTAEEIVNYIKNEMNIKQYIAVSTVRKIKENNPKVISFYLEDEEGNQGSIDFPDFSYNPERVLMQEFFSKKIKETLDGLPYYYNILARIYLQHYTFGEKLTWDELTSKYIEVSKDENATKNAVKNAIKEIKYIFQNELKFSKQNAYPLEWEPFVFIPDEKQMEQDEEDLYEAFCEEQPDGSKILKIRKKKKKIDSE